MDQRRSYPINDQDAATKSYVDSVAQGLDPKASVVYATAANIAPYTYNNGASGVGATITLTATGNLTIDGNIVAANERVLIKNEVGAFVDNTTQSAAFNGIYVVTVAGAPGVAAVLTRSADFNAPAEIPSAFTFVEYGTVNADIDALEKLRKKHGFDFISESVVDEKEIKEL